VHTLSHSVPYLDLKILGLLLQHGLDLHKTWDSETNLERYIRGVCQDDDYRLDFEYVQYILDHGYDINRENGKLIFHIIQCLGAKRQVDSFDMDRPNFEDIVVFVELLLSKGLKTDVVDEEGDSLASVLFLYSSITKYQLRILDLFYQHDSKIL